MLISWVYEDGGVEWVQGINFWMFSAFRVLRAGGEVLLCCVCARIHCMSELHEPLIAAVSGSDLAGSAFLPPQEDQEAAIRVTRSRAAEWTAFKVEVRNEEPRRRGRYRKRRLLSRKIKRPE